MKQTNEVGGIEYVEYDYEQEDWGFDELIDSILDKPFDEVTKEEWELLKSTEF